MKNKTRPLSFDQALELLRSHGFDLKPSPQSGGMLVSKYGAAAILVRAEGAAAAFLERPGILVQGEVARLLDRGYQKFIKSSQYELPATATQLHAIHMFNEELTQLTGGISLYNESLGTTSDRYMYDRLAGREKASAHGSRPWELAGGH